MVSKQVHFRIDSHVIRGCETARRDWDYDRVSRSRQWGFDRFSDLRQFARRTRLGNGTFMCSRGLLTNIMRHPGNLLLLAKNTAIRLSGNLLCLV